MKNNKSKLAISSLIIIAPVFIALAFWGRLPERVAVHWDWSGQVDGYSGKLFALVGLPLIMLAAHWLCLFVTMADPKNKGQSPKVFAIIFWVVPIVSTLCMGLVLSQALGNKVDPNGFLPAAFGIIFIVIGNYLPKTKQNTTIGIRLPWTLNDEANWNATHRLAGKLWVTGGFAILAMIFLPGGMAVAGILTVTLVITVIPCVYSYMLYRKSDR